METTVEIRSKTRTDRQGIRPGLLMIFTVPGAALVPIVYYAWQCLDACVWVAIVRAERKKIEMGGRERGERRGRQHLPAR